MVADDTDVAVLLLYHWNSSLNDITFTSERSKKSWSVKDCCGELTPKLKSMLLAIHACSGCGITSAIFGVGKAKALKMFKGKYK